MKDIHDEKILKVNNNSIKIKMITLKDFCAFPDMPTSFNVDTKAGRDIVMDAYKNKTKIFIATEYIDNGKSILNETGTICDINQVIKTKEGATKAFIHGTSRAKIAARDDSGSNLVDVLLLEGFNNDTTVSKALFQKNKEKFIELTNTSNKISNDVINFIKSISAINLFINSVASLFVKDTIKKIDILNELDTEKRLKLLLSILLEEIEFTHINEKISSDVRKSMSKAQKDYYLREQIKAINKELGEDEGEYEIIEKKIKEKNLPKEVKEKALKDLARVKKMPIAAPENSIIRNYLDVLLELPWNEKTKDNKNLINAKKILDNDHAGLEEVKDRIIEHLAVMQLNNKMDGQIICFVGPPGVGKTSISSSIARALGRKFVKMALGGIKDESELRGHRKTYVGAMPGRIIYNMKLSGSNNPVFLIDEIDKMSSDHRGDPASAMLEILDPEQNKIFRDNFLEVPYDLSKVLFIATANDARNIPAPLYDRMEIIHLSSYTHSEKLNIAKNYLYKKQIEKHGLKENDIKITDDAFSVIIDEYTYESGVRKLEQEIAKVCRKVAVKLLTTKKKKENTVNHVINNKNIKDYLGAIKLSKKLRRKNPEVGVVTGLSVTDKGGDILDIETTKTKGSGKIILTGRMGETMKESANTAFTLVKSLASKYKIENDKFNKQDIHIHIPTASQRKDGPSAGCALSTVILSTLSGRKINNEIAMTGEVTLKGKVLPVGGIKEKVYAAKRVGMTKVILPKENESEYIELADDVKGNIEIVFVENIEEVLAHAIKG